MAPRRRVVSELFGHSHNPRRFGRKSTVCRTLDYRTNIYFDPDRLGYDYLVSPTESNGLYMQVDVLYQDCILYLRFNHLWRGTTPPS